MSFAWIKRLFLATLIWLTSFALAFTSLMTSYLNLDASKFNYGDVQTLGTIVYVDAPESEIFEYAVAQAEAYRATLDQWQLQSTVIKIFNGQACAAIVCTSITRREDGYKSVETIRYTSGLNLGSNKVVYGSSGTTIERPGNSSPSAVAAYDSAKIGLESANREQSSANSELKQAVKKMDDANTELSSAKSNAQSSENELNSAINQFNSAAAAAEAQAQATVRAQQRASDSETQKSRLQKDLTQRSADLDAKKNLLAASKAKLDKDKSVVEGEVARARDKAVMVTDKAKGDTINATNEASLSHNKAAEKVIKSLDLEKSAGTLDTKKLLESVDWAKIPEHTGKLANPMRNADWCVYSPVGKRPTSTDPNRMHEGVDLSMVSEGTKIYSPISGVVSKVAYEKLNFGQSVEIITSINGKRHFVVLGHMVEGSPVVKIGQVLSPGDFIGKVGTTGGGGKVRPHLHLELHDCSDQKAEHCSVNMDTKKIIVDPEPMLNNASRCPGR